MDHPTRGFQNSIFNPVAGDSYPSVVIPDLDRKLAHGLHNLSKQLRSRLRNGSSMTGLAHLANHTCCPHQPVLTCYRNTSSAGTTAQLIKERETLSRMFQCSCCLCGGSCGGSSSEVGLGHAAPSFLLDPEVPASGGSNTVEKVEIAQKLH